ARTGENAVHTSSRLDPFQIDHLAGKELRVGLLHIVVRIHREHSKRSGRGSVASKRLAERDVVKVVDGVATSLKKRSDIISPPKCGEYVHERFVIAGCDVGFRDEHGDTGGQAVVTPNLKNMPDQIRFFVKFAPLQLAGLKRIVLERYERQIREAVMQLQVIEEPAHP